MAQAQSPSCLIMPLRGLQAWDLPGEPLHDPQGLAAMTAQIRSAAAKVSNPHFSLVEADATGPNGSFEHRDHLRTVRGTKNTILGQSIGRFFEYLTDGHPLRVIGSDALLPSFWLEVYV